MSVYYREARKGVVDVLKLVADCNHLDIPAHAVNVYYAQERKAVRKVGRSATYARLREASQAGYIRNTYRTGHAHSWALTNLGREVLATGGMRRV